MQSLKEYWRAYGGAKAFLSSRYLHVSMALAAFLFVFVRRTPEMLDFPFSAPLKFSAPLLGFTLLCMMLSMVQNVRFADILKSRDDGESADMPSPFLVTAASFAHFAFTHAATLLNAVIGSVLPERHEIYWLFSMWLMSYEILLTFAVVGAVFKLSEWYDAFKP